MIPMTSAPATGTSTSQAPRCASAGETSAVDQRWKEKRFVNRPISFSRARATYAATTPITTASALRGTTRRLVVKSPSRPEDSSWPSDDQIAERRARAPKAAGVKGYGGDVGAERRSRDVS